MIDLTIKLSNSQLTDEKLQECTLILKKALIEGDLIEDADLIPIDDALEGAKSIGGFVTGWVKSDINE